MASTKVRGITIELGADTSGLSKALKEINTEIGATQRQLKDVERLLKLDPKNTELLEQKQRLLADRIGETKTKLEALKEAQKEVGEELKKTGEGQEQYDALQREIISCENELKNLKTQAIESNTALQSISATGEKMQSIGKSISSVGDSMTRNVTVPLVGAGTAIVKVAGDFEQQMAKVSAISQAYGNDLEALKQNAMDLSKETVFSANEIAQAYEYMGMAGWDTNQILAGTPGILDLAAASGEDLAEVSDIVTDGLTAFGLKAEDTSRFCNVLAEAARSSNTNVSMMGESFKYVGPVAGQMGYSVEDVAVALGTMANSGIKASLAGTTLRNIMQRMAKPTEESSTAMERLGISLTDDEGKMYSLNEIMQQLRSSYKQINMPLEEYNAKLDELDTALEDGTIKQKEYDKELEELNKQAFGAEGAEKARAAAMLGGTRAMAGLMAIAGATDEEFQALQDSINNSSETMVMTTDGAIMPMTEALAQGKEIAQEFDGTAAAMAGTMENTTQGQMKEFTNQLQTLAIDLGETLLPILSDVVGKLSEWVQTFSELDPETQDMIVKIGLLVAALGPLLSVGGRVISGTGTILTKIPSLVSGMASITGGAAATGGSLTALLGPIAAVVAAIAGITAAFVTCWNTNETFRENITGSMTRLETDFNRLTQGIVDKLNQLGFDFENIGEVIQTAWETLCNCFAPLFENAFDYVAEIFEDITNIILGILDIFTGLFTGNWEQMWNGVKEVFSGVWGIILDKLKYYINALISQVNGFITGVNSISIAGYSVDIPLIPTLASGGILTSGTAIVGEAGPELLSVGNGQAMVQPLGGQSGAAELQSLLETYLPYLAAGTQLIMDSGALVGSIAPDMNTALGTMTIRGGRR